MGKYAPVIKTAECGSMTRAAHVLGYTQPSLGYIINNIENDLGVKLVYRDQRGVTLTETGSDLLKLMRKIEAMEDELQEAARVSQWELLRVGIFAGVSAQWMPEILEVFSKTYPKVVVKLETEKNPLAGELALREHRLDCCFHGTKCPPGMELIPLYKDPYYLVVSKHSPLALRGKTAVLDLAEHQSLIPTNECAEQDSVAHPVYEAFAKADHLAFQPQENQMAVALVERGLGISVLPGLALRDCLPGRQVQLLPLKEGYVREIGLLCPRETERSPLANAFLRMTQEQVELWKQEHDTPLL